MKHQKILLVFILLLAAAIRLYRISDFMVFLGDEGRDALLVKGILEGHFTLLGPRASAGDFFTGPIYYYLMAPFLWLFRLDPVGPAIMVALFSVATVYLLYIVGKKWFNPITGLAAAALYAVSPLVIIYSRSSWNPNTVPFFSLLTMYLLYIALTEKKGWRYFVSIGVLLGILVQLHYISLFLGAIVAVSLFIFALFERNKHSIIRLGKHYLLIFGGFLGGFSPFLAFEMRHEFPNIRAIFSFVTTDTVQKGYMTYDAFYQPVIDVLFRTFGRLVFNFPVPTAYKQFPAIELQLYAGIIVCISLAAILVLWKHKNKTAVMFCLVWLFLGTFLFGFYKKAIYDYYLVFLFPLPFLIIGFFISQISHLRTKQLQYGWIISSVLFGALFFYNIYGLPIHSPNKQKDQMKNIAQFVLSKTENKPFNFALLTPGNSDHAYRYFMDVAGHPPVAIQIQALDPQRSTVTKQLMIVCEDPKCNPLGNPLFEVAGFGQAKIAGEWQLPLVKVYKLVHEK